MEWASARVIKAVFMELAWHMGAWKDSRQTGIGYARWLSATEKSEGRWDVLVRLNGTLLEHNLRWEAGSQEDVCKEPRAGANICMKVACWRRGEEDWHIEHYQPKEGIFLASKVPGE